LSFVRQPLAGPGIEELTVEVAGGPLSGLLAEPADPSETRALIVAIHGAGMHAGYFDSRAAPGQSLLELGSRLGYTVWAPDRPGVGASSGLPDDRIRLQPQAELLLDAIDAFCTDRPMGAGVVLVGHSYGLKVAWCMAASPRGHGLLGVDGSGCGVRFAFDSARLGQERATGRPAFGRDDMWGPRELYPKTIFARENLPVHDMPQAQSEETVRWPHDIRSMADRITVPLRLTYGEYERIWPTGSADLDEVRKVLRAAPELTFSIERFGGHNLSLGWAARPYHLKVLAFAESCRMARLMG
jgi:pimeloyl-ACP methyl ester carboxylesterase